MNPDRGDCDVALVTAPRAAYKWPDVHTPKIAAQLTASGISNQLIPWYEPGVDWSRFDLTLLRTPWDIYWNLAEFMAWVDRVEPVTNLHNPASVLRWNLDKRYLLQLAEMGIPTTPTTVIEVGEVLEAGGIEFVVKPVTSGGSLNTARYVPEQADEAAAHVELLHERSLAALVQPYLPSVDEVGEKSLVFYRGVFDHAIHKQAVLGRGEAQDSVRESHPNPVPYEPSVAELDVALAGLAAVPHEGPLLFARVDIADGFAGSPVIMELELTDPELFFDFSEGALSRYTIAVANSLRRR